MQNKVSTFWNFSPGPVNASANNTERYKVHTHTRHRWTTSAGKQSGHEHVTNCPEINEQNKVSLCYIPCTDGGPAGTHTTLVLSNWGPFTPEHQSQVLLPSNNIKYRKNNQLGFFPGKMSGKPVFMEAANVCKMGLSFFFKNKWWWLHGHHLAPEGLDSDPPWEPPRTPYLTRPQLRCWT